MVPQGYHTWKKGLLISNDPAVMLVKLHGVAPGNLRRWVKERGTSGNHDKTVNHAIEHDNLAVCTPIADGFPPKILEHISNAVPLMVIGLDKTSTSTLYHFQFVRQLL